MTRFALAIAATLLAALPSLSLAGPPPQARVDILPGWRQADGSHMAAVRILLDDGWKTYWRAPGEAGLPPRFDWSGSENLGEVRMHWPVPEVVRSNGMTTLGYHRELVLPIEIQPVDPEADIALSGALTMGICEDICMPLEADVTATLPAAPAGEDARIAAALEAQPASAEAARVASARCRVAEISDGLRVTLSVEMPAVGPEEFVVVEAADRSIWVSEALSERHENTLTAEADLVPPDAKPFDLDPGSLRFTVLSEGRGVDIRGCEDAG